MLRSNKRASNKAQSLTVWIAVFAIVVAGALFLRTAVKRTVIRKVMATTDAFVWTAWGDDVQQYKNELTSYSKSAGNQAQTNIQAERAGVIKVYTNSTDTELSASVGVEDGSEIYLPKGFDLSNETRDMFN